MNTIPHSIRHLATRLIVVEAAREPSDGLVGAAARACDKLRLPLAKLAGVAGFRSLMSRTLALATAEMPCLALVQVRADGTLEGFEAVVRKQDAVLEVDVGVVVVAQLLGLLVTFIGEPLTLRLVRDAWPESSLDVTDRGTEGQP